MKIYNIDVKSKSILKIYGLNPIDKNKFEIGNKAQSLLKLDHLEFDIPNSIFLDYSIFHHYRQTNDIPVELIDNILNDCLGKRLAIRSSSNIEDSLTDSYAGLFETSLNVVNKEDGIKNAIIKCYHSVIAQNSIENDIRLNGICENNISMGVIIQKMIEPKFSGIVFTSSPINPDGKSCQIQYQVGSGKSLTGSRATGYSLTIDKESGNIVEKTGKLLLSDMFIKQLGKTSTKLEEFFNSPQDFEFVISKDAEIFLLQSRPITAFSYTPEYIIEKEKDKLETLFKNEKLLYGKVPILSHTNISELFPTAVPLGYSIFKAIFAGEKNKIGAINRGRKELGYATITKEEQEKLFVTIGDQARVNLLIDALTFRLDKIEKNFYIDHFINHYIKLINDDKEKANYPEFGTYIQYPTLEESVLIFKEKGGAIHTGYSQFTNEILHRKTLSIIKSIPETLKRNDNFYNNEIYDHTELEKSYKYDRLIIRDENGFLKVSKEVNLSKLIDKFYQYLEFLNTYLGVKYVIIARIAFLNSFIVKKMMQALFEKYHEKLFNCHNGDNLREPSDKINKYFDILLTNEKCPDEFKCPSYIEALNNGDPDSINLNKFRQIYGHIGSMEISQPRLGELKDEILKDLLRKQNNSIEKEADCGADWLVVFKREFEKLKLNSSKEFENFHLWVRYAGIFLTLRQTFNFELLKIIYLIKILIKEISSQLNLGDLIYYLNHDELEYCQKEPSRYRLLTIQRKAYFNACRNIEVDKVIIEDKPSNMKIKRLAPEKVNGEFRRVVGTAIHHGEAEGICLVAKNPDEYFEKLIKYRKEGIKDIIGVFSGVEPAYFNLRELKGFITKHGGLLAHAATIARENNIPYISDVNIDLFQDGDFIIFDAHNSQVIYQRN